MHISSLLSAITLVTQRPCFQTPQSLEHEHCKRSGNLHGGELSHLLNISGRFMLGQLREY